jgi:hypothetical protein
LQPLTINSNRGPGWQIVASGNSIFAQMAANPQLPLKIVAREAASDFGSGSRQRPNSHRCRANKLAQRHLRLVVLNDPPDGSVFTALDDAATRAMPATAYGSQVVRQIADRNLWLRNLAMSFRRT